MRALHLGLAALAFGVILSGCSGGKSGALAPLNTTPAQAEAHIAKLFAEPFKGTATAAADIAAVRDALPKEISLTWETLNFDAASGATVLTKVKLAPADMTNIGLGIDEIRLWDFDADFAKARLAGQRLEETARLARRIEAKGLAVFGLETLIAPGFEAYTDTVTAGIGGQLPPEAADEFSDQMNMTLDGYEFSLGRILFDDLVLRPFELKPLQLPPDNEFAEIMPFLQPFAAVSRAFASDATAMLDFKAKIAMTQMGESISFDFGIGSYGARGVRGLDTDAAYLRDMTYSGQVPNPELPAPMEMVGGFDVMTMEGMKFDKLAGYLARGEWPAREAMLLSFGKMVTLGERISLNGHDIYSVAESVIELRDFHWFIPTTVRLSATDVVFDVNAFVDFVEQMSSLDPELSGAFAGLQPGADTPGELVGSIMETLGRYGLDRPSLDYTLGWNWNAESGATTLDGMLGLDGYMRFDAKFSGALPTFKGVSDLIPGGFETADGEAIGQLFASVSNLKLIEANIVDEGGLDKGFALAVELGKMMPVDPGQPDFFANQSPESLRQLAVAGVYALRDQAAREIPELRALLSPFGAFVERGGRVKIAFKPRRPLGAALVEDIQGGNVAPADLLKDVTVQHTPPPGGPAKSN